MPERWFRQAVIYCLDVDTYQDSNGDGIGDLPGLIDRLDHLARLGVTCIWLNPIHPSPDRDDGYDITDFYAVHPRLGTLGDFVELIHQADNRGIRVMIDLVVNHTSDEHPWFQSARSDPSSPYRDWYVWSKEEPTDLRQGMVFPGYQDTTWTFDDEAGQWYYHRFYDFQPDLNMANPRVRQEIEKIIGFWLQLGVAGFRLDAAPFIIELTVPGDPYPRQDFSWLNDLHDQLVVATRRRGRSSPRPTSSPSSSSSTSVTVTASRCCSTSSSTSGRSWPSPATRSDRSCRRWPRPRRCPTRASGRRSCATTTRSTSGAWSATSTTRCSRRSGPIPTCSSTAGASAGGWRRCSATIADGSRWPTPCSSACPARPSSATATRSAWART